VGLLFGANFDCFLSKGGALINFERFRISFDSIERLDDFEDQGVYVFYFKNYLKSFSTFFLVILVSSLAFLQYFDKFLIYSLSCMLLSSLFGILIVSDISTISLGGKGNLTLSLKPLGT